MESDELLIAAVKEYPCLYNSKLVDFKVPIKKENSWSAIYVKEIRKKKKKTGDAAKVCVPWELLPHMEFINDYIKHRK